MHAAESHHARGWKHVQEACMQEACWAALARGGEQQQQNRALQMGKAGAQACGQAAAAARLPA
jgi:hypothetical protein